MLDILFATTTMVTALAHGATEVRAGARRGRGARPRARTSPQDSYVLSGELYAETLPGFAHPAPLALVEHGVQGKTRDLLDHQRHRRDDAGRAARRASTAARCSTRAAWSSTSSRAHPRETVLIVCSGSGNNFNFEDFYGAGYFVERFAERLGAAADFSDAAKAARALYRQARAPDALLDCRVGRMMAARGLRARGGVRLPARRLPGGAGARAGQAAAGRLTAPRRARARR